MNPIESTFTPYGPAVVLARPAVIDDYYGDEAIHFIFNTRTHRYHVTFDSSPIHRDNGPAIVTSQGLELWVRNGAVHRDDGPAWLDPCGTDWWLHRGQQHREGGPAQIRPSGYRSHWIHGMRFSRANYELLINLKPDLRSLAVEELRGLGLSPHEIGPYLEAITAASTQLS